MEDTIMEDTIMDEVKEITIIGKHTKDHLTLVKTKRIRINAVKEELNKSQEILLLGHIMNEINTISSIKGRREIEKKIYGYNHQDIIKHRNANSLISFQDTLDKLLDCNLSCNYCTDRVKLLYMQVRDPKQWTLDRIDNDLNHSKENTIISCLSCNIKRRRIDKEKYEFTKKMIIVKVK